MYHDPEINAMGDVLNSLHGLDNHAVKRVLDWATSRFGLEVVEEEKEESTETEAKEDSEKGQKDEEGDEQAEPDPQVTTPEASATPVSTEAQTAPQTQDVQDQSNPDQQGQSEVAVAASAQAATGENNNAANNPAVPANQKNDLNNESSTKGLGLKRFKSIENLFLGANTDTVASRIILAAAFLQEKMNYTELSSYDINSRLKKMGYGVTNITNAINGLLNKRIPLMEQTRKEGDTKQSKRKFVVTEEGLKLAKTYLKGVS
jgi:hypothetical protein